jgi:hypothetical protein
MTKDETATIENLIARLSEENCGCHPGPGVIAKIEAAGIRTKPDPDKTTATEYAVVSRIYLNTWIIPALQMLLPGADRDPKLARSMSGK